METLAKTKCTFYSSHQSLALNTDIRENFAHIFKDPEKIKFPLLHECSIPYVQYGQIDHHEVYSEISVR
jgi:hypothetical protein